MKKVAETEEPKAEEASVEETLSALLIAKAKSGEKLTGDNVLQTLEHHAIPVRSAEAIIQTVNSVISEYSNDASFSKEWNNTAQRLKANSEISAALLFYSGACLLAPSSASMWHDYGVCLNAAMRYSDALSAFRRALTIQKGLYFTAWHAGLSALSLDAPAQAEEFFASAVEPSEHDNRNHLFVSLAVALQGRWGEVLTLATPELNGMFAALPDWIGRDFRNYISKSINDFLLRKEEIISQNATQSDYARMVALIILSSRLEVGVHLADIAPIAYEMALTDEIIDLPRLTDFYCSAGFGHIAARKIVEQGHNLLSGSRGDEIVTAILPGLAQAEQSELILRLMIVWALANRESVKTTVARLHGMVPTAIAEYTAEATSLRRIPLADTEFKPTVTVVVPTFNAADFLSHTLRSIKEQTLAEFECIIVNDSSTDGSAKVAEQFVRSDNRFRLLHHRANSGLSASRNTGLRAAAADLICFLDSDDLMMRDSLELRVQALLAGAFPYAGGVYSGSVTITEAASEPPKTTPHIGLKPVSFLSSGGECPFNANQPLLFTHVMRQLGGFDETLDQAEDYDMWMRLLRNGYVVLPVPFNTVTYRARRNSMIRRAPLRHLEISWSRKVVANQKLPAVMKSPLSPSFLYRPWFFYRERADFVKRACEFAGMAIAQGRSPKEIADQVSAHLGDYKGLYAHGLDLMNWIIAGYKRHAGNSSLEDGTRRSYVFVECYRVLGEVVNRTELAGSDGGSDGNDVEEGFLGWRLLGRQKDVPVVFFPHKDYHILTTKLIQDELNQRGVQSAVVDFSVHYRDEGVRRSAAELDVELVPISAFMMGFFEPKVIVSYNDWDPIARGLNVAAERAGVATVGIVEGIQDYLDVDTKRVRDPYRTVQHVLLPGAHDEKYFVGANQSLDVIGIPRVYELRKKYAGIVAEKTGAVLINSNFSYGVLENARDKWVALAVSAVRSVGLTPIISRHPADRGETFTDLVTSKSFYEAVEGAELVINRFASGMIESMAMMRPVIYFNPHGERVDKFHNPGGAFPIAHDESELASAIIDVRENLESYSSKWSEFLDMHSGEGNVSPASKAADVLARLVNSRDSVVVDKLRLNLALLDQRSAALSDIATLRDAITAPRGRFTKEIERLIGFDLNQMFFDHGYRFPNVLAMVSQWIR